MKKLTLTLFATLFTGLSFAQQTDWSTIETVFGKKGNIQDDVFKITFPRYDLKVKVGSFSIAPSLALTSWIGFMKMGAQATMMGDLVLLDSEVAGVISKLVAVNLEITAEHNHLINEIPAVKYLHFSGTGDAVKLAEAVKSVIAVTATSLTPPPAIPQSEITEWPNIEAILGKGKRTGNILQFGFPRNEKLTDNGMEMPPYMGMATAINFQIEPGSNQNRAAITGDFVLLADEVNPVVKMLTEHHITVTALHNHMLYDSPRLFMMHFWAVGDPENLAKGLKAALGLTNSKR